MSYCINRKCKNRQNDNQLKHCSSCGTPLLIHNRYRLIKPLRSLDIEHHTEVWKVEDIDKAQWKVMKILETDIPKSVALLQREAESLKFLDDARIPKVEDDCFFTITLKIPHSQLSLRSPLAPLKKGGNQVKIPFSKGDLEESHTSQITSNEQENINYSEQSISDFSGHTKDDNMDFSANISSYNEIKLHCLVMEYIEGENLEDFVNKNGKISQYQALNWLKQLLDILKYLHRNFYLHRDIKPSNIILKPNGQLALIDLGSARNIKQSYYFELDKKLFFQKIGVKPPDNSKITQIISEGYTAPEQLEGAALPQSDFYALGRTFVHLVTGKHPIYFYSPNINKLIWRQDAKQITNPLADLIDDLTQPDAAARPQNPRAIANRLTDWNLWWREWLSMKGLIVLIVSLMLLLIFGVKIVNAIGENYYQMGKEKLLEDDLPHAREYLEKAIKINPNESKIYNDLGLVCKQQSDIICAVSQYEKAIKLASEQDISKTTIYYNLANLYEDIGDRNAIDKATKYYLIVSSDLTANEMENPIMTLNSANNYARLQILYNKNNLLALETLQKALAQTEKLLNQPEMKVRKKELLFIKSKLSKNIGWAYLQEGELEKAKKALETAITLDPEKRPENYCLLAQIEEHLDIKKSLNLWEKCQDYSNEQDLPEVMTWQNYAIQYLKNKE